MALEAVTVVVLDAVVPHDPVEGLVVRVYDETGTTFITSGTTDSDGTVSLTLEGDDPAVSYQLRTFKQGVSIPQPQVIEVFSPASLSPTGTNSFSIDANVFVLPEAVDPRLCRVSGYIKDPAGRPKAGIDIQFIHRFNPLVVGEGATMVGVLGERVAQRTDRNGYFQLDLWRGGCYRAIVDSHDNVGRVVYVPDQAATNVMALLFPRAHAVVFDPPGPWSVAAGSELVVRTTVELTSGYVIEGTAPDDLLYEVSPGSVAVALEVRDDALVFRGLAPGAATLSITRAVQNLAYTPDPAVIGDGTTLTVV